MVSNDSLYCCRVCGFYHDEEAPPWGANGNCPSFDICGCCGAEFGYDDCTLEDVRSFRKRWLEEGAVWFVFKEKPTQWSLEEQMRNIPEKFK